MERAQRRLGIELIFISAVDGRDPDAPVVLGNPTGRLTGRPRSRVDYAVVASHRRCWERMLTDGDDAAIVLEDDVLLADDFARFTEPDWIPEGVDIVKLETIMGYVEVHGRTWNAKVSRHLGRLESLHLGAAGYLITRGAAIRLLEATTVPFDPIDHILFTKTVWDEVGLTVVQADPAPVVQGMYHSDYSAHGWASSSIQADRDNRGITMKIERHRQVGGRGGLSARKLLRPKTAMHMTRWVRSALNGGAYKRIQFG